MSSSVSQSKTPVRRCLVTVWSVRPGGFSARAELDDGTRLTFDSPFELVRFLSAPAPVPPATPGLR
jgi:hypothetical protein